MHTYCIFYFICFILLAVTKAIESRLSVMEVKMLRWMAGVTRMDRVCNKTIRQRTSVAPMDGKLREALYFFGCGQGGLHPSNAASSSP